MEYSIKKLNKIAILCIFCSILIACNGKIPGADARKYPADPKERVKKNLEEGRGFTFNDLTQNKGKFDFASSNELWRASLDVIDFMPLTSVNYSGGIIITDWYSGEENQNESIKISIRFLSNLSIGMYCFPNHALKEPCLFHLSIDRLLFGCLYMLMFPV